MVIYACVDYQADNEDDEEEEEEEVADDDADEAALRRARAVQAEEGGEAVDAVQLNSVKREMTFLYFQNTLWKKITGGGKQSYPKPENPFKAPNPKPEYTVEEAHRGGGTLCCAHHVVHTTAG